VLRIHAGSLQLRGTRDKRKGIERLRAHVALALSGHDSDPSDGSTGPPRPDTLRVAFNGPFWPHILTTTAVGQEGLDLHLWCQTVVHWDPPSDPLALEQREGRIDRHAGLAVRKAIACKHGDAALAACERMDSPWGLLISLVDQIFAEGGKGSGLSPWWVFPGAKLRRITLVPPISEQEKRMARLRERLDVYRLAMGQPHSVREALADQLGGAIEPGDLRRLAIDLSAARLRG
jgi:hypothetical protein